MKPVRICLVGATGLVGSRMIEAAVGRPDLRIVGSARREMRSRKMAKPLFILIKKI